MAQQIHELVEQVAQRTPSATALRQGATRVSYAGLAAAVAAVGGALLQGGAEPNERVAVCLPPRPEAVAALLGASSAGCAFVGLDPDLAAVRCAARLRHSGARLLVTDARRLAALAPVLADCPALRTVVVLGGGVPRDLAQRALGWDAWLASAAKGRPPPALPALGALLYRDSEAGEPVASALSHLNLVAGAASTARCLGIGAGDRILAALPLHVDHGLNALLATLSVGASAVLPEAADAPALAELLERGEITGLSASPATWEALAHIPLGRAGDCLRYIASAGGSPERPALDAVRRTLPRTRIHLMYDVGDACRSTCLMPSQLEERPGSIGRPMPYADWLVLRADGRECAPGEAGELVQRGPLVTLGYWNDPQRSAAQFRTLPPLPGLAPRENGRWPGVTARKDMDGYLYLVEARSDTITTGGYRVSPREVEKIVVGTGLVAEAAAVGVAHPVLGQVIAVLATARPGARLDSSILFGACRARLPQHMLPAMVDVRRAPLPRARDGQIDRALLAGELAPLFAEATP
ncbi:AMP-binding protein [Massilia sp.]|uniref:AMP-binding protein n=1 Tax=Massilia sp. TaxID=1882437 RepID=UPI0028AFDCC4|nr:AMP-binding protein [Massilia sp.]